MAFEQWSDYFIPGTDVLQNKLGITDYDELRDMEYAITGVRREQLRDLDRPAAYDQEHLKAVHQHLFQDVYPWAGEYRTVGMSKEGTRFADPDEIGDYVQQAVDVAEYNHDWAEIDQQEFIRRNATMFAWLNMAHPFREGNGRVMKTFCTQVSEQNPNFYLDFNTVLSRDLNALAKETAPEPGRYAPTIGPAVTLMEQITRPAVMRPRDDGVSLDDLLADLARDHQGRVTREPAEGYLAAVLDEHDRPDIRDHTGRSADLGWRAPGPDPAERDMFAPPDLSDRNETVDYRER